MLEVLPLHEKKKGGGGPWAQYYSTERLVINYEGERGLKTVGGGATEVLPLDLLRKKKGGGVKDLAMLNGRGMKF